MEILDQENNASVEILDQSTEVKKLDLGPSLEDVISEACQSSKISRRSKRIIKKNNKGLISYTYEQGKFKEIAM